VGNEYVLTIAAQSTFVDYLWRDSWAISHFRYALKQPLSGCFKAYLK